MSSSLSDGSTDPLVARFKVLEETVEKLHRENKTLKHKLQSYNTLNTFYQEAKQQLRNLNLQLADKDGVIRNLKANRAVMGAGELPQVAGVSSQSLVESLVEQLTTMKSKLKETERACEEKVDTLNQEIQRLHQELEEKDKRVQQYSSWPQHEKEMEICRLQKTLAEKEKMQATSEVLCRSLSDESNQLRRKLAATAEMCQHLVKCLEEAQKNINRTAEDPELLQKPSKIPNLDCSSDSSLNKLQEENRLLKQKVVHVEDLNAKWQKYDASREEYVKGVHKQLKELKACSEPAIKMPHSSSHAERMQKEIIRLNKLLEEKMAEQTKLKQEAEGFASARIADSERIQMLEQQLLVYKDDFISERSDRERAQCKIQELLEEVSSLQRQIRRMDDQEAGGRFQILIGNKNKTYIKRNVTEGLRGSSSEPKEGRKQVMKTERVEGHRDPSPERRGQDELQCPHCLQIFRDRLGDNFLEHISECCQ
ncbi:hypothetical protein GDO86_000151 [Hymenochirus boettgeri]|uniref:TNFAIP3-interacting protein 2 n=1 Tax=Hymenochirus boettgeri TaxID=247094 RepID=A0A8T2KFK9_9PIPI|nr:hypothetical protein GDO86_000151 [Hymenochirus boettgeri]